MALIYSKELNDCAKIGIWKIDETAGRLKGLFFQNTGFNAPDGLAGNELRMKQRLCSNILVNRLLGKKGIAIEYDDRVPVLAKSDWKLSLSHSGPMVACILDKKGYPGIDIERFHPRIEKIASRFLHPSEQEFINPASRLEQLTVIWCAKEVLFKIYRKGGLIFKENLIIQPFECKKQGVITGEIRIKSLSNNYLLTYETLNEYMLVHSLGK